MKRTRYTSMADINITNLVDVMMVLLIVFMLTAPFLQAGVRLSLPKAEARVIEEREGVTISVDKEGAVFIGREQVRWEDFASKLRKELEANEPRVFLRADKDARYGSVMRVIARVKMLGIEDLGLIAEQDEKR